VYSTKWTISRWRPCKAQMALSRFQIFLPNSIPWRKLKSSSVTALKYCGSPSPVDPTLPGASLTLGLVAESVAVAVAAAFITARTGLDPSLLRPIPEHEKVRVSFAFFMIDLIPIFFEGQTARLEQSIGIGDRNTSCSDDTHGLQILVSPDASKSTLSHCISGIVYQAGNTALSFTGRTYGQYRRSLCCSRTCDLLPNLLLGLIGVRPHRSRASLKRTSPFLISTHTGESALPSITIPSQPANFNRGPLRTF
jgi:hypothetical protein